MLLVRALDERPPFAEQDEALVTYAEKITAADRTLDPAAPAGERARVVRALQPAHRRAHRARRRDLPRRAARARGRRTRSSLDEVQPPGGRPMAYADWARGRPEQAAALGLGGAGA